MEEAHHTQQNGIIEKEWVAGDVPANHTQQNRIIEKEWVAGDVPANLVAGFGCKLFGLLLVAVSILSIIRGIRFPSIWTYAHFLFHYDLGFVKRGLIGSFFALFNIPFLMSYEFFMYFSFAIFIAHLTLLALLLRDLLNSRCPALIACAFVYVSGVAFVYLAHSIGFFDHIGLLVTLIALRIKGFYRKLAFLAPALPIAIATHEAIFLMFFPVIFMSLLLAIRPGNEPRDYAVLGIFSAGAVILVMMISNGAILEPAEVQQMYDELRRQVEYPIRGDAFAVLHKNIADNLAIMNGFRTRPGYIRDQFHSLLVTVPSFLLFSWFSWRLLKAQGARNFVIVLALLAPLSVPLLHLVAWDLERWNTLLVTASFLVFCAVYLAARGEWVPLPMGRLVAGIVLLIFLNGISDIKLFSGRCRIVPFPFVEHQQYWRGVLSGKAQFPAVPRC